MRMSILGLYKYDPNIFANMNVPSGMSKDRVIDSILLECADLEILYPSSDIMKIAITAWAASEQKTWNKLWYTMNAEYNPLWNVDADITETETGERNRTGLGSDSGSGSKTDTGTNTETRNRSGEGENTQTETQDNSGSGSESATDTRSVKGYNSTAWSESEKNVHSGNNSWDEDRSDSISASNEWSDTDTLTGRNTLTESTTLTNENEWSDSDEHEITRTTRRTGNIGVTSSQQLMLAEREVAMFNVTDYIVASFKKRFCIMVY